MNGPPLAYVKVEINKTLNAARSAKFYIVFFNSRAEPQPNKKWTSGKKDIDALTAWVQGVNAGGGTQPVTGFLAAFQIDPPPDVIYFMTDGQFDPQQVQQIKAMNAKLKKPATIHGIAFGRGGRDPHPADRQGR